MLWLNTNFTFSKAYDGMLHMVVLMMPHHELQGMVSWQRLFVSKLNASTKLVGSTISCEGSPKDGNVNGEWRTNPHVQSYILATDQVRRSSMYHLILLRRATLCTCLCAH